MRSDVPAEARDEGITPSLVMMSLASLARLAQEADFTKAISQAPQVVRLREAEGTSPAAALVLIHPVGGSVLPYRDLGRYLLPNRAIYGIQSRPGDARSSEDKESLTDLAREYIVQIRHHEPSARVVLGGYCLGGAVAFEMARQLRSAGVDVDDVIIIDTPARLQPVVAVNAEELTTSQLLGFAHMLAAMAGRQLGLSAVELDALVPSRRIQHVLERLRELQIVPADSDERLFSAVYELIRHNEMLQRSYLPVAYDGNVSVIRTTTKDAAFSEHAKDVYDDPSFGWQQVCGKQVHVEYVPGSHFQLLYQPFIQGLGACVQSLLDKKSP